MRIMKFASLQDIGGYRRVLEENSCEGGRRDEARANERT
jgi:hypothetical protein